MPFPAMRYLFTGFGLGCGHHGGSAAGAHKIPDERQQVEVKGMLVALKLGIPSAHDLAYNPA